MGVVRAKNARQKRKIKREEPKVFENTKRTVLIKGVNVSNTLTQVMHDFHRLKVKKFFDSDACKQIQENSSEKSVFFWKTYPSLLSGLEKLTQNFG